MEKYSKSSELLAMIFLEALGIVGDDFPVDFPCTPYILSHYLF